MEERIFRTDEVNSTNLLLQEMVAKGAKNGQVVIARRQSAGAGRVGRSFASPEGGLYLSYLYRPDDGLPSPGALTAAAAVAVCRALESFGVFPGIKWVNDLLLGGRKICGILCQALSVGGQMAYIVGIGINVTTAQEDFPDELRDIAGSILGQSGLELDMDELSLRLIGQLDRMMDGNCLEAYRTRCVTTGRQVQVVQGKRSFCAFAEGIDEDFSLLVRKEDGTREAISFGEVSVRV